MIILAADTSTSRGSVALRLSEGTVLREELGGERPHSETLLPAVEKILARAALTRADVQIIAVGTGPGSFTGLRVGLATFKAWAEASDLPIIPVVSLDAVALPALRGGSPVVVLADARKGEVYAAFYPDFEDRDLPRREGDVVLIPHEEVPGWVSALKRPDVRLVGTGMPHLLEKGLVGDTGGGDLEGGVPDAVWVLALAEALKVLGRTVRPSSLVPFYVRSPDARKPSPGAIVTGMPGLGGSES